MSTAATNASVSSAGVAPPAPRVRLERLVCLGEFSPAFLALARSCRARGVEVYLLEVGRPQGGRSRCMAGCRNLDDNWLYREEGIRAIREYLVETEAQALIALSDKHNLWLSEECRAFDGIARLLAPSYETLDLLRSKQTQADLARRVGLDVLPTHILQTPEDAAHVPAEHFPLCLRPSHEDAVRPDFKVAIAYSPGGLAHLLSVCRVADAVLGQPFLPLPTLVVHGISSAEGEPLQMAAFLADRKFQGITLRLRKAELPAETGERLREFSRFAGLTGAYHFELLHDARTAKSYFLEVNPRLGGTTDKVVWLDFDEPSLLLAAYGYDVAPPRRHFHFQRTSVTNKRSLAKHMISALGGNLQPFDYPQQNRWRQFRDSAIDLFATRDSVFCFHDLPGAFSMHLRRLRNRQSKTLTP